MKKPINETIKQIFLLHYQEWCFLSFAYLHDMQAAEDVVQDVMVKMLTRKEVYKIEGLSNYIKVAVKNASLQKIKQDQKVHKLDETISLLDTSYEQELIYQEEKAKVQMALNVLPEQSKRVFELCIIEGLQYQNTADIMGISTNTVKYHLKKAFKILRHTLSGFHFFSLIIAVVAFLSVKN
ncbi:sigma-70 family RNA polymerase sigma factor [Flagellimonas sediminis]|uniref:Sigma-70 family RNA polymerase sigma factor n=1 Tax=Flagellimonas sediminis TaxID=2696468 RepID=A0A6I5L7G7_9FLAO|nr:sigma-70 family RNA polymerase sigma factor [Allomuricauda sediminis]NDV44720.1 sigma-70 family RNA polymerase sigma factor [Allomuricauda sediminis]